MIFTQKHRSVIRVYLILLAIFSTILAAGLARGLAINIDNKNYENFIQEKPALPSVILDVNGKVISELVGVEQRTLLEFNDLPKAQVFALLTREDNPFFYHSGFSVRGFMRALVGVMVNWNTSEGGGSTLTNQLAKIRRGNVYQRTIFSKLEELWESWQIERQYSKQEILQMYLNKVNFGHGAYGVEAISQYFFEHSARTNNVAEAAMTSIQMARPTLYSPDRNPTGAKKRQRTVLDQMVSHGYTTKEEADLTFANYWNNYDWSRVSSNTVHSNRTRDDKAQWFTEYIREETKNYLYGTQDIYSDGYKIHTTLDLDYQAAADKYVLERLEQVRNEFKNADKNKRERTYNRFAPVISLVGLIADIPEIKQEEKILLRKQTEFFQTKVVQELRVLSLLTGISSLNKISLEGTKQSSESNKNQIETALITLENSTGQIRALIGGSKFEYLNQYNRALQADVSPGSSFKPLYYSAGISSNQLTAGTRFIDQPKSFEADGADPYTPNNYGGRWYGNVLLRYAMIKSLNIPAIEALETVGFDAAIDRAAALLGIFDEGEKRKEFPRNFPLALGTNAVSPAQMARAYTAFANAGRAVDPYGIRFIEDQKGKIIAHVEDEMIQRSYQPRNQVMTPQDAYIMTNILESTTRSPGTLYGATRDAGGYDGMAMAGKTGTSQNWKDSWTIGYSPYYTTSLWFGFDQNGKSLGQWNNGAALAGRVWAKYMRDIHTDLPKKDFHRPDGIVERTICTVSGDLATQSCPDTKREIFKVGTEPTKLDTYHTITAVAKEDSVLKILDDLIIEASNYERLEIDNIFDDTTFDPEPVDDFTFDDFDSEIWD